MATQIGYCIGRIQFPLVRVFADEVVDAADLSGPFFVLPGSADGGDVFEPSYFGCDFLQFVEVSELPGAAGGVQQKELVVAMNSVFIPIAILGYYEADEWINAGHSTD